MHASVASRVPAEHLCSERAQQLGGARWQREEGDSTLGFTLTLSKVYTILGSQFSSAELHRHGARRLCAFAVQRGAEKSPGIRDCQ